MSSEPGRKEAEFKSSNWRYSKVVEFWTIFYFWWIFMCMVCRGQLPQSKKPTWCAGQVWFRGGVAQARVEASRLGSALQRWTTVIIVGDVSSFYYSPHYRHCDHCQYGKSKIRENLESSLFYKEYIWLRQPILGSQWNIVNSCFWGVWQLHGFPPDHIFIQTE